jgi:3-hydroxybutyryl-CoA dehydratase
MSDSIALADIKVGDRADFSKTITESDVYTYAGIVGDFNPMHVNKVAAANGMFEKRVAHGMLSAGLVSTVLGTKLPGPGTVFLGLELSFEAPVFFGDTLTAECVVTDKREDKPILKLSCTVQNQDGKQVLSGKAVVMKKEV